jgi:tRNA dimethylallyltransferase
MIIAIVGSTASGKSDLALYLAKQYGGEIICADSRTVYRGMDIGTAKPSQRDQQTVRHHLLDVINPDQRLGAASFKRLAEAAEVEILGRGNIPLLVGGSGMYIDAVMYGYKFPGGGDPVMRKRLESLSTEGLAAKLAETDRLAYERIDLHNRRRLIRALETVGQASSKRDIIREDSLMLGLSLNKELARKRIAHRVDKMLEEGFIDEVRTIGERYGWDGPAMHVIGYQAFRDVVMGTKTVGEARADFIRGDMLLYKKQVTWFKRNPQIHWISGDIRVEAEQLVQAFLKYT